MKLYTHSLKSEFEYVLYFSMSNYNEVIFYYFIFGVSHIKITSSIDNETITKIG